MAAMRDNDIEHFLKWVEMDFGKHVADQCRLVCAQLNGSEPFVPLRVLDSVLACQDPARASAQLRTDSD